MNLSDAAEWADVVMILTPDELQASIYKNHIEQSVKEGTSIAFAHGLNVHYDLIKARKDLDVFMVAPKGPGHLVRSEFEKGGGVPCLFAVHQNGSGKARDLLCLMLQLLVEEVQELLKLLLKMKLKQIYLENKQFLWWSS